MNKIFTPLFLIFGSLVLGSDLTVESQTDLTLATATSSALLIAEPTPMKKLSVAKNKKAVSNKPQSAQANTETAYTPVYAVNSKECKKDADENMSEGDDFQRACKGFGGYELVLAGFDYRVKHEIRKHDFSVMLFPLENGDASRYERADLYDLKFGEKIEWRLDKGKPYAIVVRASFYKNTGSAKTFSNPKNKVAEFVFVRGLKGFEDLKVDLPTVNTAFDPDEQARSIAVKYLEKHRR